MKQNTLRKIEIEIKEKGLVTRRSMSTPHKPKLLIPKTRILTTARIRIPYNTMYQPPFQF